VDSALFCLVGLGFLVGAGTLTLPDAMVPPASR